MGNILNAATGDGEQGVQQQRYDDRDPVRGLLDLVRREYGLPPDAAFETVGVSGGPLGANAARPRPHSLSLATAQQLGVLPTRTVIDAA